ncbi:hypothetical protein AJ80_06498 [Polytolypa hystricis UAMH7299]|uniref:Cytochrome P450 alkane hydroxylase n=1 Tax=Polytolypa hystricis (strain UAMH7299) TaxID=1447883 RepID=A0A2B7XML2_POLH7|nr:hypothetical protein AJ80_06498 [Polytolypa hystricis UAMH7299]
MIGDILATFTATRVILGLLGLGIVYSWLQGVQISRRVRALGVHAPLIKSYYPLSLDFIIASVKNGTKGTDLEYWSGIFEGFRASGKYQNQVNTFEVNPKSNFRIVFTVEPENIKAILAGQFADYGKGKKFHDEWKEFLGDSIFATDGELWSRSRHLLRPMFARERIVDTEIFEKHIHKLIPMLGGSVNRDGSTVVDVGSLFFRYTLDASTDYLFGQSVDSLDNPKTVFAESFQYVLHRQSIIFRAGPVNFLLSRKLFRENLKKMDDFMQPFIDQVLAVSPEELEKKLAKKDTFLDALARFTRDPKVLRDQLVAVLLAGRDTTAATLAFCVFELSRHPSVVKKLRAEIFSVVGPNKKPSYTDIKDMKYLNAVLNETMRLYPVVPFNVRHALKDTTLPTGGGLDGRSPVGVLEGTRIVYSTMVMQRRRDLYDPPPPPPTPGSEKADPNARPYFDPGLFIPERWLSSWHPKPWHFIPFNGGPRICLGQQFATIEMAYTITRILQAYSEIVGVGCPPVGVHPKFKFDVTLSPGGPMNCVFVKSGEEEQGGKVTPSTAKA